MPAIVCHEVTDLAFPIKLIQNRKDDFTVVYGKQITAGLNYSEACMEYGRSVLHALACDGKLDNREPDEE